MTEPILEVRNVTKMFGSVIALSDVSAEVYPGEVTCLLGDNGAGKSTLIKILCGVHQPTDGDYFFEGEPVTFNSPREALDRGHRHGVPGPGLIPLMPIWRNFFLGAEPEKGLGTVQAASTSTLPSAPCARSWARWASTSAIPTSRWAPCRAASASRSPSPGPSISGPRC